MADENKKFQNDGGIWKQDGQYGEYLSGSLEVFDSIVKFHAYPNKYKKEGDNKPDYRIVIKGYKDAQVRPPTNEQPRVEKEEDIPW